MTIMDLGVALLVGGAAIAGFARGFVQEVLSLAAWVAAVMAVRLFHTPAAALARDVVSSEASAAFLAFVLLFGVVFAIGKLIARSLGRASRTSLVGPFDRVLGAGFGMGKGLLIATVLFMAATFVVDLMHGRAAPRPDWMRDSRSYAALNATSAALSDFIDTQRDRDAKRSAIGSSANAS